MKGIVIYGAGKRGRSYYSFLQHKNLDGIVVAFCDKQANDIQKCFGKPVVSYDEAVKLKLPFLIGVGADFSDEVKALFLASGITSYYNDIFEFAHKWLGIDANEINREYCAWYHLDFMDKYFKDAENENNLNYFWGGTSFRKLFSCLNLANIVELACGRGRHVPQYLPVAGHVTLVDVLEKNIDICKKRFKKYDNISYYKNNGHDLQQLSDNKYTALFSYDAMVHFELLDIAEYLFETYRILVDGGMALFHHSNNHADYKASFATGIGGRSFMSKEVFAHLAYRAGFEIVEQELIDRKHPELDCLTLVKK